MPEKILKHSVINSLLAEFNFAPLEIELRATAEIGFSVRQIKDHHGDSLVLCLLAGDDSVLLIGEILLKSGQVVTGYSAGAKPCVAARSYQVAAAARSCGTARPSV